MKKWKEETIHWNRHNFYLLLSFSKILQIYTKSIPFRFRFAFRLYFFLKRNSCVRDQNLRKWNSIFCLVILCVCLNCVKWKTSKLAWRGTKRYCSSLMLFWAILLREWMNNERDIGTSSYFTLFFIKQIVEQRFRNCRIVWAKAFVVNNRLRCTMPMRLNNSADCTCLHSIADHLVAGTVATCTCSLHLIRLN